MGREVREEPLRHASHATSPRGRGEGQEMQGPSVGFAATSPGGPGEVSDGLCVSFRGSGDCFGCFGEEGESTAIGFLEVVCGEDFGYWA